MIIFNKGHIFHYLKKKAICEVCNMKNIFKEEIKQNSQMDANNGYLE